MKFEPKLKNVFEQICLAMFLGSTIFITSGLAQEQPFFLKGSVEQYSAASKPLDPSLWPGNDFNKQAAHSLLRNPEQEASIWHRIPEWEAGKWEGNQAVNVRAIKYIN